MKRLLLSAFFATSLAHAQTPAPSIKLKLIDTTHIVVTDSNTTGTVDFYKITSAACPTQPDAKTIIPLTNSQTHQLSGGDKLLVLREPLTAGTILCAADTAPIPNNIDFKASTSAVYTYIPARQPVFTKNPSDGASLLQVQATPSDSAKTPAWTTSVQLLQLLGADATCNTSYGAYLTLGNGATVTAQNTDAHGAAAFTLAPPPIAGTYICAAQTYTITNGTQPLYLTDTDASKTYTVSSETDWGLVRAYFTGGLTLSNDNSNFSSAHQFLELNLDKTWILPTCIDCGSIGSAAGTKLVLKSGDSYTITGNKMTLSGGSLGAAEVTAVDATRGVQLSGKRLIITRTMTDANGKTQTKETFSVKGIVTVLDSPITYAALSAIIKNGDIYFPEPPTLTIQNEGSIILGKASTPDAAVNFSRFAFNTFFDTRLTAIPVSANPTNTVITPATGTTPPATPTTPTTSFINTQTTARVGGGLYAPVLLTRWTWNSTPNALFIAPLAKIGFDTITGSTQQNVIQADGTTGTQTYAQAYKFWSYGARVGHMKLSRSANQAPEMFSFIDISLGPYSNLESLICGRTEYTGATAATTSAPASPGKPLSGNYALTNFTGSACTANYPSFYIDPNTANTFQVYEMRKRIYRFDLEGLLKIPGYPLYVGFNANIGQKGLGAGRFDPAFKAPDDIRFFFGTHFDISTLFSKLGVKLGN